MKHFRFLLLSVILLLAFPLAVSAAPPTAVGSPEDLAAMADRPEGTYALVNDIDMTGVDWTPITFTGHFDGQGYKIKNLSVTTLSAETRETVDGNTKPYDTSFGGLFGVLEGAWVENVTLENVTVTVDSAEPDGDNMKGVFLGLVAGYAGDSRITNCTVIGTVSLKTNAKSNGVGGFVGFAKASEIAGSSANVTLILTDTDKTVRDENFLGGAYAAGYCSVTGTTINLDAYDSCHGYVHSGGLVGMYYPFGYAYDAAPRSSFTDNTVRGKINFFEDNKSRRAYCEPIIGEVMNWNIDLASNATKEFVKNELFTYDTDLSPETVSAEPKVNYTGFTEYKAGSSVTLYAKGNSPLVGMYLVFWEAPESVEWSSEWNEGTLRKTAKGSETKDEDGSLQRYIDLTAAAFCSPYEGTVSFPEGAKVCGVYPVTECDLNADGSLPSWVHDWKEPCEAADILLLSSHADDEQLFFAGILPYYARVRNLDVQVVYFTDHLNELKRHQERLNGLWEVGIRHYPASIGVPDAWADDAASALKNAESSGWTEESLQEAVRTAIETFRPKVIIGHDEAGEYKHGQHMLNTAVLEAVLNEPENGTTWAASREYLERVFLHLYETNPVTLSFLDTPYGELGGKTPFQVTQHGFESHQSQMWTWFKGWLYGKNTAITRADQIATYSPLLYGQYYGADYAEVAAAGDFFAGLTSYEEDREEQERIEREIEEQRRQQEEAERQAELERQAAHDKRVRTVGVICLIACLLMGVYLGRTLALRKRTEKKYTPKH